MKFKEEFPNIQLLLRRTIQSCKEDEKNRKARNKGPDGAVEEKAPPVDTYAAYGGAGVGPRAPRAGPGAGGDKKGQGGRGQPAQMRLDKFPGFPGAGDEHSVSPGGTRRRRRRSRGGKNIDKDIKKGSKGGSDSKVPELPELAGKPRGNERITSGRHRSVAAELAAPNPNIRQWMLTKQQKEKERERNKRRVLEKEMKWIEKMALKQQKRNKQMMKDEEREQAATVIQGGYRTMAARKMVKAMKEDKRRREEERKKNGPTLEEESARLFDD